MLGTYRTQSHNGRLIVEGREATHKMMSSH